MSSQTKVINACLLAGRILIENGSEMSRVLDTMQRIAYNAGIKSPQIFMTVTGVVMSVDNYPNAQVVSITRRTIDLQKVTMVNSLSRSFAQNQIDLDELITKLETVDEALSFPIWLRLLAAAMLSAVLLIVFTKDYVDAPAGFIAGGIGYAILSYFNRYFKVQFLSEFIASLCIGILAAIFVDLHIGASFDNIIIGAIMPLVPGVPITNAVRDLVTGNLISGPARAFEALLSTVAIGSAIVCVLNFI
ncbi:threonine/serine exporter family protein [Paucilactobacillus sp. N302-9]